MTTKIIITGLNEANEYFKSVAYNTPKAGDDVARALAKDTQKGARHRLTVRTKEPAASTGRLWNSIIINRIDKGKWQCEIADMTYGLAQERGLTQTGWKFIPMPGTGRRGEGFMRREPGAVHVIKGKHFFSDAVASTISRAGNIADRRIDNLIRTGK